MKKTSKLKILSTLIIIMVVIGFISPVFASGDIDQSFTFSSTATATDLESKLGNVWGIVSMKANFIAVVMVVVAGIRYMFASADQKAEFKQSMAGIIAGIAFAFAAGSIVSLIISISDTILS